MDGRSVWMDVGSYYFSGGWVSIEGIVGKTILLDAYFHLKRTWGEAKRKRGVLTVLGMSREWGLDHSSPVTQSTVD